MLLVANWKAYVDDLARARELFSLAKRLVRKESGVRVVLAPPAPFLSALASGNTSSVLFAAQDISATTGGAQTGEVIAGAYASAGAAYAIIGHSERRAQGDTNAIVAEKLSRSLAQGLLPILCIGEHERDSDGHYLAGVREQLTTAFAPLTLKERKKIIVAYEPLWAINKSADQSIRPSDLTEMVLYLRKVLGEFLPGKGASHVLVLYGGSVEPGNERGLAASSQIDGFLVGHASVDSTTFAQLVRELA